MTEFSISDNWLDQIQKLRAEIERLTRERDEAWAERDPYIESNVKLVAEVKRLKITNESLEREIEIVRGARGDPKDHAEIARLTAIVQQHEIWQASLVQQLVDKDAEVERLTAERKNCPPASEYDKISHEDILVHAYAQYVRQLETEIERLPAMTRELSEKEISQAWFDGDAHTLRVEIERLKIESNYRVTHLLARIVALHAEVERLTETQMRKDAEAREQIQAKDAEIERLRAMDKETIQALLDLLNPLHGELDRQTYDQNVKANFDAPGDAVYTDLTITIQMERDLTQAVLILESRLRDVVLPQPPESYESAMAREHGPDFNRER